jgi:hypothetical protein
MRVLLCVAGGIVTGGWSDRRTRNFRELAGEREKNVKRENPTFYS